VMAWVFCSCFWWS